MKKQRILKITFILLITLFSINYGYAAVQIKDTTERVLVNKSISEFYDMSEEMKNPGQGLEGTTVDVKMANNYEWAVVSYFSNSSYGTGGAGEKTGVLLDGTSHYSTNGNITGVMDWGKTRTFTAGIIASYAEAPLNSQYGQSIIDNAGTNRVDKFSYSTKGEMAIQAWYGSTTHEMGSREDYPFSVRLDMFGFLGGYVSGGGVASGIGNSSTTFRPIFYAQ